MNEILNKYSTSRWKERGSFSKNTLHSYQDIVDAIRTAPYGIDTREAMAQMMMFLYGTVQSIGDSFNIDMSPTDTFENVAKLKEKYPNGQQGVFVVQDTGHWYFWSELDEVWKDGGIYQSEGNVEVQRMRTPDNSITSEVFDSADKAINVQLEYLNRKINSSSNLKPQYIYPFKKEDYFYDKKDRINISACDSYFFEIDYDYLQSFTIETNTEQYSNVCAFLDKDGAVISYIRKTSSDDSTTRVSVQKPVGAETLVVSTKNDYTKFSVQSMVSNFPTGWFRNGSWASDYYAPIGINRLIVSYDTTNKDVIFTPKDSFEVYDNVQKKWVATPILLNSGLSEDGIQVRKNDNSIIKSRDINGHFDVDYVIHDSYIPNDVDNGLTDITNTFNNYQVGSFIIGTGNEITFNTNVPNKWNNGWYSPETDEQLLFDIKPGYQLYFLECIQKDGKYYYSQAYMAWNPNQKDYVTGKQYFNLYADHSYIWVVKKDDETQFSPFSIKSNVNIYRVDIDKHIPDYYKGYLVDKINSINDSNSAVGDFSTLFITDIHAEHNTKHSIPLVKQVMNQCSIRLALGGGDWATAWFSSKDVEEQHKELKQRFIDLRTRLKDIPMLKTIGNHEWAYGSNNGYNINIDELYRYYLKDDADKLTGIVYGEDGTYSYYDDTQDKCRYISVNVSDYPTVTIPTGQADNKEWYFAVSDNQKAFITNALKSVPGDDWNVIIESHLVPLDKDQMTQIPAEDIGTVISNGNELRKIAENYVAKTEDFAQAKGTLVAWLGGHYHRDDITTLNGVTYVTTNGDCIIQAKGAQERVVNSTSEQCFDVFSINRKTRKVNIFRIGAGDNREFNY